MLPTRFVAVIAALSLSVLQLAAAPSSAPSIKLDPKAKSAELEFPAGYSSVLIERKATKSSKWTPFKRVKVSVSGGRVRISLPGAAGQNQWRVTGTPTLEATRKYPAACYLGPSTFNASRASRYTWAFPLIDQLFTAGGLPGIRALSSLGQSASTVAKASATEEVAESDIWKTDGSTVYFFNQLRGLQVLDLSNPSSPELRAYLRMAASGQDLYLLPGSGDSRDVLLLTREIDPATSQPQTGLKLVEVSGSSASVIFQTAVAGVVADSRISGDRLYVVTSESTGTTLREFSIDQANASIAQNIAFSLDGTDPVVSAGAGWLAVALRDPSDSQKSKVTLFELAPTGASLLGTTVGLLGQVEDKFKIQYSEGVLSVISQRWEYSGWLGTPISTLETFAADGTKLGSLEIVRGETLYATRFAGRKAYAVTFRMIDPLWVIDLQDPAKPVIAGSVEIPGWSTHIEAFGDLLFSVGYDQFQVAASLFDVSDPSAPSLLKRVQLPGYFGNSEANYNEKALKLLPEAGLALIPYTSWNSRWVRENFVQVLDLDLAGRDLRLRGTIAHDFEPRRAELVNGALASISQRELVTADISDRDKPSILAEYLLAWPVDRIVNAGEYLVEIASGNSWADTNAVARIASVGDPDSIITETDLGAGTVKDAVYRGGKLYVLREAQAQLLPFLRIANLYSGISKGQLSLDIYELSNTPELKLLGSVSADPQGSGWEAGNLLWPGETVAAVVVQSRFAPWLIAPRVGSLISACLPYFPFENRSPQVCVFQVADPAAPQALAPLELNVPKGSTLSFTTAGANLLLFGYGSNEFFDSVQSDVSTARHWLGVLDLSNPLLPTFRPAIDLPGKLVAITDLTSDGFLAWTETRPLVDGRKIQVSVCDGNDAFQTGEIGVAECGAFAALGRSLFVAQAQGVTRYALSDNGLLQMKETAQLSFTPETLVAFPGGLLGGSATRLFRIGWTEQGNLAPLEGNFPFCVSPALALPLQDGSLLVPAGDYGVESLKPR